MQSYLQHTSRKSLASLKVFSVMLFFMYCADALMSYLAPIVIEKHVGNLMVMGIILSSSSVFGILTDFFVSKQLASKDHLFFSKWLLALALFFPMSFLLFPLKPLFFVVAMAVWGVYYEFIAFSQYNFVHAVTELSQHSLAWAKLDRSKYLGILVAPLLAGFLFSYGLTTSLFTVLGFQFLAIVMYVVLKKGFQRSNSVLQTQPPQLERSFLMQLKIWRVLLTRIWPVYLFFFTLILLETVFWSIGPLLSEQLRSNGIWGALVLPAFIVPSLFTPYVLKKIGTRLGKKRIAFVSAICGGLVLGSGSLLIGQTQWYPLCVFIAAVFIAVDYPEIEAVFEDYISRADSHSNDLIGLQGSVASLAYIVGPVMAGTLALFLGMSTTIGMFAFLLSALSAVLLFVTPRKIKLPQQALALLDKKTIQHQ